MTRPWQKKGTKPGGQNVRQKSTGSATRESTMSGRNCFKREDELSGIVAAGVP